MNGIDVIKTALDRTRFALNWYVSAPETFVPDPSTQTSSEPCCVPSA